MIEGHEADFAAWLVEAKKRDDEHKAALIRNPEGGCYYLPHPVLIHSGQYWRCAHGQNAFWAKGCWRCLLRHPIFAWRWHFASDRRPEPGHDEDGNKLVPGDTGYEGPER